MHIYHNIWHFLYQNNFFDRHLDSKTLGLPYWNWLAEDQTPPNLAWRRRVNQRPNPFANMTVRKDLEGNMRTVQRDKTIDLVSLILV